MVFSCPQVIRAKWTRQELLYCHQFIRSISFWQINVPLWAKLQDRWHNQFVKWQHQWRLEKLCRLLLTFFCNLILLFYSKAHLHFTKHVQTCNLLTHTDSFFWFLMLDCFGKSSVKRIIIIGFYFLEELTSLMNCLQAPHGEIKRSSRSLHKNTNIILLNYLHFSQYIHIAIYWNTWLLRWLWSWYVPQTQL